MDLISPMKIHVLSQGLSKMNNTTISFSKFFSSTLPLCSLLFVGINSISAIGLMCVYKSKVEIEIVPDQAKLISEAISYGLQTLAINSVVSFSVFVIGYVTHFVRHNSGQRPVNKRNENR